MRYRPIRSFLLLFLLPLMVSCSGNKDTAGAKEEGEENGGSVEKEEKSDTREAKVTVKDSRDLDGCQYLLLIEGNEDEKLHPLNLDPEYFEDGLELEVRYREKAMATTCMAGTTVELLEVKKR